MFQEQKVYFVLYLILLVYGLLLTKVHDSVIFMISYIKVHESVTFMINYIKVHDSVIFMISFKHRDYVKFAINHLVIGIVRRFVVTNLFCS